MADHLSRVIIQAIRRWLINEATKLSVNWASTNSKDAKNNPLLIAFARLQGVAPPPIACLSARNQYSQENYESVVKPAVEEQWLNLPEGSKDGKKAPPLSFKNTIRDAIYNDLPSSEKDALKDRAKAAKQVKVLEYEAALNALPSKDPEIILRYISLLSIGCVTHIELPRCQRNLLPVVGELLQQLDIWCGMKSVCSFVGPNPAKKGAMEVLRSVSFICHSL